MTGRFFTSKREVRLWILVLLAVIAIYSSLALTAELVGQVNEILLGILFFSCLIVTAASVVTQGFRVRPGGVEVGIAAGMIAVFVLLGVRMAVTERTHLMEYGVLTVLIHEAVDERRANRRGISPPAVTAFVVASLLGFFDEFIQAVLPNRVFDSRDILFNNLAAFAAAAGMSTIRRVGSQTGNNRGNTGYAKLPRRADQEKR